MKKVPSPCLTCTRVRDPEQCENKACSVWRAWFIARWDSLRSSPRLAMEQARMEPVGVSLGGRIYAPPHQVREYLEEDPCEKCLCPKDLCTGPCRVRRAWEEAKGERFL